MEKRTILLIAAAVLVGLLALAGWSALRRRTPTPTPSPSPSPAAETPPTPAPAALACPAVWGELPDFDADGLPDAVEGLYLTNEASADTDADGFPDGAEVRAGYNPLKKEGNPRLDSDGDGLRDDEECVWKTNPFTADTDGDSFADGDEVRNLFDPTIKGDGKGSDALPERRGQEVAPVATAEPGPVFTPLPVFTTLPEFTPFPASPPPVPPPTDPAALLEEVRRRPVNTNLPSVAPNEVKRASADTPEAIRAYLAAADRLRPLGTADTPDALVATLQSALAGNTAPLSSLVSRISSYEQQLRAVAVPPSALEHHRLLLGLTRFLVDRLGAVVASATTDPVRTVVALREVQEGLLKHLPALQNARTALARRARVTD